MNDLLGKVVCGLERCTRGNGICQGVHCPYHISRDEAQLCRINLLFDVCSLLQIDANAPRVMTLEEVPKYDGAFLIEYRHEVWPMQWTLFRLELTIAYRFIRADYELGFSLTKDSYGRTWRCWTSRPTDEQREATPWKN